jgi:DNA-binding MarR family transcriptional regulator
VAEEAKARRGGYLITRVSRAMGRSFEALMREEGLSNIGSGEGRIVYLLWRDGAHRQGELASKAGVDKSTLALTLARMERKGLVERRKDTEDARSVVVSLGVNAAAHGAAYERVSLRMGDIFYRGLSAEQIEGFESILEKIIENLE